jgi:hypothetical protein
MAPFIPPFYRLRHSFPLLHRFHRLAFFLAGAGLLAGLAACSHDDQTAHQPYYHYGWYYYGG